MLDRRSLLKSMVPALASLPFLPALARAQAAPPAPAPAPVPTGPTGPFTLPPLPYAYDALEPFVDAKTMEIHHGKHHAAYVKNANKALEGHPELQGKSAEWLLANLASVPEEIRTPLRNNLGGHVNHSWFWNWMKPGGGKPSGALARALDRDFGGLDAFQAKFSEAALKVFGSGWAWLTADTGKLTIVTTPNQENPIMKPDPKATAMGILPIRPLLGIDVWEHAYYLKHQNVRADWVKDFFAVVNWDAVGHAFDHIAEIN